jgi:hypothetical protein
MSDEQIFMLVLEAKGEKSMFDIRVEKQRRLKSIHELHQSGKLAVEHFVNAREEKSKSRKLSAQKNAKRCWAVLRIAVRMGSMVASFVDGARQKEQARINAAVVSDDRPGRQLKPPAPPPQAPQRLV